MALNYETLIQAASKNPEERTATEVNDFIFPWLKQSLKKKQGIFQKISDEVIYDICKSVTLERRPAWNVVIRQGDPGDTFYIILQGSVKIYRLDDEAVKAIPTNFDMVVELNKLDHDPDKREDIITQMFGNYIVTLEGNGFAYRNRGGFDFGERALVTNEPRSATVMTVIPTDLLVVDREVFSRTLRTAHEKELQEKNDFINRCPLFSQCPPRIKRLISLNLERGRFAYDSVLYKQGTRADAIYFIWSGEVKLSVDPLLHWLQYPQLFPKEHSMRQEALDFYSPFLQSNELFDVRLPPLSSSTTARKSSVIKRRSMSYSQAENQLRQRITDLALLSSGDFLGLDSYFCELPSYLNSARCTSPCDLFYILKHNFIRLIKRNGITDYDERLCDMVRLSWKAYSSRILHLPLFQVLSNKYLSRQNKTDQHQNNSGKQIWLFHSGNRSSNNADRAHRRSARPFSKDFSIKRSTAEVDSNSRRNQPIDGPVANAVIVDYANAEKIQQHLRRWHENYITDSKSQIVSLKKWHVAHSVQDPSSKLFPAEPFKTQFESKPILSASLIRSMRTRTFLTNRTHVS